MANVIKPDASTFYYTVTRDDVTPNTVQNIQKLNPPATLIDNSDSLWYMTGVVRSTWQLAETYWIDAAVDPNGFSIPDWIPTSDGASQYTQLDAAQLDTVLILYRDYYTSNTPASNYTLDLRGGPGANVNESPNDGALNQYIVELQGIFSTAGYVITILIN